MPPEYLIVNEKNIVFIVDTTNLSTAATPQNV